MAKKTYRRPSKRKRRSTQQQILGFLLVLIVGAIVYLFLPEEELQLTPTYSSLQNEQGFYYYQDVGISDYTYTAQNLIGQALMLELRTITNDTKTLITYGDVRQALEIVDRDLNETDKLWGAYDNTMINAVWDQGETWDREHVWPNSRLGLNRISNTQRSIASDLHNLRAATGSINSSKSDRFFSDGSGGARTTTDGGFYPGDDHRGDVARILFYMAITYDYLVLTDDLDLLLDESYHYEVEGARMGQLSLLLTWHKEDPVSAFEIARNNRIFEIQGNRNPLIDRPEFVHLIWENKTIGDLAKPETVETSIFHLLTYMIKPRYTL